MREDETKPEWLDQLLEWKANGTLKRLSEMAEAAEGYHSGEPYDGKTILVKRTASVSHG